MFCHSGLDPESSRFNIFWIPAFAGMTISELFARPLYLAFYGKHKTVDLNIKEIITHEIAFKPIYLSINIAYSFYIPYAFSGLPLCIRSNGIKKSFR